jgi:hypothetical protein
VSILAQKRHDGVVAEHKPDSEDRPQWTVWRQDDNGNRYVVAHHVDRDAAEAQAAEMEAHGHKQTYWVAARQ